MKPTGAALTQYVVQRNSHFSLLCPLLLCPLRVACRSLLVCLCPGDFAILHIIACLTGGGDHGRCPFGVGCLLSKFLRYSCHETPGEERTMAVVAMQWELAVWMLAEWLARYGNRVTCRDGDAWVSCPTCKTPRPLSAELFEGSGVVHCANPESPDHAETILFVTDIAATNVTDAMHAARRLAGGVRGIPLLRHFKTQLQAPVLHSTGSTAKMVLSFILATLPEKQRLAALSILLSIVSKGKKESLYLREYRELVAAAVACPDILSPALDPALYILLQLFQLVNAAWRSALTDESAEQRRGAAVIMQLAASILGPLFEMVKPLDPEMKGAKVITLYMHAPVAHVRHQVGDDRADVAYIADDNMEGHIRGVGRFLHNHGGNSPQAAIYADLAAMQNAALNFRTPRSHPSALIFTTAIRLCKCWRWLGDTGAADFAAIRSLAREDPDLHLEELQDGDELLITLPLRDRVAANGEHRRTPSGDRVLGKKEALRRGLRVRQKVVVACFCGALSQTCASPVMRLLPSVRAAQAVEDDAALTFAADLAVGEAAGGAAGGAASGDTLGAADGGVEGDAGGVTGQVADGDRTRPGDRSSAYGSGSNLSSTSSAGGEHEAGAPKMSSSKARRLAIVASMPSMVPPRWLLALIFSTSTFFDTVITEQRDSDAEPPTDALRASVVSQHIAIIKLFRLRTKTYSFTLWMANSKLHWQDIVEAADALLDRLREVLDELTPTPAESYSPILFS